MAFDFRISSSIMNNEVSYLNFIKNNYTYPFCIFNPERNICYIQISKFNSVIKRVGDVHSLVGYTDKQNVYGYNQYRLSNDELKKEIINLYRKEKLNKICSKLEIK